MPVRGPCMPFPLEPYCGCEPLALLRRLRMGGGSRAARTGAASGAGVCSCCRRCQQRRNGLPLSEVDQHADRRSMC